MTVRSQAEPGNEVVEDVHSSWLRTCPTTVIARVIVGRAYQGWMYELSAILAASSIPATDNGKLKSADVVH